MTLRLADAILLGDSLKKSDPDRYLSRDGSCGCAFGGALLAAGCTPAEYAAETDALLFDARSDLSCLADLPLVRSRWPWLLPEHLWNISSMYFRVADGLATIEQIATYADSIDPTPRCEPQEPSQVDTRQESTVSHG